MAINESIALPPPRVPLKKGSPFSRELGVGATGNPRSDDIQNGMRTPYAAAINSATMQSKLTPNTAERNIGRSLI